ncbi:MAG: MFS transporter [Rhodospirillaceae bacterium]|nr:MFS transporter [Rhodospirillaceae bacterium]
MIAPMPASPLQPALVLEPAYRWVIVIASAIMMAGSLGLILNGVSVFLVPLEQEFGWGRGPVSFINFAGLAGIAIGGIVMSRVSEIIGVRKSVMLGAVAMGLSVLLASQADQLWQFYAIFFVGSFIGGGSLFAPMIANTSRWFKTGVGLAIGIVSGGQALGQGLVPYFGGMAISAIGWRGTFLWMGVLMLVILPLLALLIRPPPAPTKPAVAETDQVPASHTPDISLSTNTVIIWMSIAVILCCTTMSVPLIHLVPYAQSCGIPLSDAGGIILVMLIAGICGRVAFGKLADMIGAVRAYWVASAWQTTLVIIFLQFQSLESLMVFAVIYGFGYGGVMTTILVSMQVLTPVARRASATGIVTMFAFFGHAIGGYQGGLFFDLIGNYGWAFANAAIAGAINLVVVGGLYFAITRRPETPTGTAAA